MIRLVEETLHDEPYTKDEILNALETSTEKLNETSLTPNTQQIRSFKLKQRALHVFNGKLAKKMSFLKKTLFNKS